jgi:hypothetical protein
VPGFLEQKTLIDAAVKAGIKRFLPSEISSNTLSDTVRQLVPIFEPKKVVLDYFDSKESTGLSWTGFAVGCLFDWVSFWSNTCLKNPLSNTLLRQRSWREGVWDSALMVYGKLGGVSLQERARDRGGFAALEYRWFCTNG